MQTDRTIANNKLDIIIRDNETGTCLLLEVEISRDRNVTKKEAEKVLKYKDLTVEIQRMWNVKTNVIPVIIGPTGTFLKSFRKYLSNIPGKHKIKELQKTAILGTHTHTFGSTNVKVQCSRFNIGTSDVRTMNSSYRIAATMFSLATLFLGI